MIRVEVDRMMGLKTLTAFAMACALLTACSEAGTEAGTESDTEAGAESAAAHGEGEVLHWGYEEDDGPVRWGAMKPEWQLCAEGLEQSPIDLTNTTEMRLPEVLIEVPSSEQVEVLNQAGVIAALDNGHTIQINSKTGEMMTVGAKTYELVQFHFHAPSEHTVDAVRFPMEMHFVYQADDGALAVSGVLIVEGEENPGIAPLWEQLAAAPGSETTVRIPREFGDQIFSDPASAIYHYRGSLTTPPCSEGVQWYISKTPTQFSEDQIAAFRAAYNHNNRSLQPLNERTLYLDPAPVITIR
jgi:carbonic anhydrase